MTCEEGLYLYQIQLGFTDNAFSVPVPVPMTTCVSDCPMVNQQTANDPVKGRCAYLGIYCMYGNYTHGCLETLLPQSKRKADTYEFSSEPSN